MEQPIDLGPYAAHPSGAPDAGGATSRGSSFGGDSLEARLLRMAARLARAVEATAYRRLRDLERHARAAGDGGLRPGAPRRVREAAGRDEVRIH